MSAITTHVLDTARGRPAAGVGVRLDRAQGEGWETLSEGWTDADGRLRDLLPAGEPLQAGTYRLTFATGEYHERQGGDVFFPEVAVVFRTVRPEPHFHVPLLLSPFGYSTYRGS